MVIKVIICKGLPASGKSTWAKAWVKEDPTARARINRDDIRRMLGPYWVPKREDLVSGIELANVCLALGEGYSVVIDATNFSVNWEAKIKNAYSDFKNIEFEVKDFTDVTVETCIIRDLSRPKEEQVGEEVIKRMYNKYLNKDDKQRGS